MDVLNRVKRGALFHAYIISGGTEAERRNLAKAVSKAIVCAAPGEEPCNTCNNCYKAENDIHPDIIYVTLLKDKREIIVDQIREITASSAIMPNEAERKVYIIPEAEKMNGPAQNAMLKILEEPPRYLHFLLLTDNVKTLLPTVRSRCTELNITPRQGDTAENDEAKKLFEILKKGDDTELLSFVFKNEKIDREELWQLSVDICRMAAEELRKNESVETKQKLLKIAETFLKIQRYIDANVSSGHAMNLILAELAR